MPQAASDSSDTSRSPTPLIQHETKTVGGWLRVLAVLLTGWEPVSFAFAAASAFNAIAVRGVAVALVLAARLATTALCVAAGQALLGARPSGVGLARAAVVLTCAVSVFAAVTPYFPSNRLPGQTAWYVGATVVYYGGWLLYLSLSKRVRDFVRG